MSTLSRRRFLQRLVLSGFAIALPSGTTFAFGQARDPSELLASRLSWFFVNRQSAQVVGRRYLALAPDEANVNRLTELIARTPENYVRLANTDIGELRALLSVQQRQDFEQNLTASIDGWILSETEARLCAIAAIS